MNAKDAKSAKKTLESRLCGLRGLCVLRSPGTVSTKTTPLEGIRALSGLRRVSQATEFISGSHPYNNVEAAGQRLNRPNERCLDIGLGQGLPRRACGVRAHRNEQSARGLRVVEQ